LGDRVNIIGDNTQVSVYINSIDKFYTIDERNWVKLANNKTLNEYAKNHNLINLDGILKSKGLTGFV
jgi:hypothetical protein